MKKSATTTTDIPPSPQPPSKSSRKILIAVIVIVAIVAVAVGVYLATRGGGGGPSPSATSTPPMSAATTPTRSPTSSATSSGSGANIAGASSLQFDVSITNSSGANQGTETFYGKNLGKSNMMIRVEMKDSSGNITIEIANGATQKLWMESGGQWIDQSSTFTSYWSTWTTTWNNETSILANWLGAGSYTYTMPDGSITLTFTNIQVNPALSDSLFTH